jgi:ligand-binding SRPBCC domain-containing protein
MRRRGEFDVTSVVGAPAPEVWQRATSAEGINDEMRPWFRMTVPRGVGTLDIDSVEPGRLGRSWLLLFGLLPVDYDDLTLARVEPGRAFLERSTMLTQRLWEHERTIEPLGEGGCALTDRVAWEPRLPLPGALLRPLIAAVFRHRHSRLRRRFGGEPVAGPGE